MNDALAHVTLTLIAVGASVAAFAAGAALATKKLRAQFAYRLAQYAQVMATNGKTEIASHFRAWAEKMREDEQP